MINSIKLSKLAIIHFLLMLYLEEGHVNSLLLIAILKKLNRSDIQVKFISEDDKKEKSFKSNFPNPYFPIMEISGKKIFKINAIAKCLIGLHPLIPKELDSMICESYNELMATEMNDIYKYLILPILGKECNPTKDEVTKATTKLKSFLSFLNNNLTGRNYLVGNAITLCDMQVAANLFLPFELYIEPTTRKAFSALCDWFLRICEDKEFKEAFGPVRLCFKAFKVPLAEDNKEEKGKDKGKDKGKEKEKEKEKNKNKDQNKDQGKAEDEKKPKHKKEEDEDDDEDAPKKKSDKNPLDSLPKSKMDLDQFKRDFLAAADKRKFLQEKFFNQIFDNEGYSLWYVEYIKAEGECEKMLNTSNLCFIYMQRFDKFGRYGFGVQGIFGEEPQLSIKGVYMWRGKELPFFMTQLDQFEYYTKRKLDTNNPDDRKLVEDFWCSNEDDIVNGLKYQAGKYFR